MAVPNAAAGLIAVKVIRGPFPPTVKLENGTPAAPHFVRKSMAMAFGVLSRTEPVEVIETGPPPLFSVIVNVFSSRRFVNVSTEVFDLPNIRWESELMATGPLKRAVAICASG